MIKGYLNESCSYTKNLDPLLEGASAPNPRPWTASKSCMWTQAHARADDLEAQLLVHRMVSTVFRNVALTQLRAATQQARICSIYKLDSDFSILASLNERSFASISYEVLHAILMASAVTVPCRFDSKSNMKVNC